MYLDVHAFVTVVHLALVYATLLLQDLFQVTSLMHIFFILYQYMSYIIILNMFRAVLCSS